MFVTFRPSPAAVRVLDSVHLLELALLAVQEVRGRIQQDTEGSRLAASTGHG